MEIIIIILLIILNGVFSMSEMSLVSARKFKLESAKKKGNKGAKTALELSENPTKFLSTVQIGITLIGILLGVYSGENLTNDFVRIISLVPSLQPYANNIATIVIVVLITYISIVFGELLPKRIGMTFPEPIAMLLAKPMHFLSMLTSPFVWLLTTTNNIVLSILGIQKSTDSKVTEEEIKSIIKESADGGEIQDIEHNIVERVFELGDRKVNTLYTHRTDIVFFTLNDSLQDIKNKVNEEKHSAYPVCKNNNLDEVLGIVLLKDLFGINEQEHFDILSITRKPNYFVENTYAYKVLETFKSQKMHYGIVVDEYGSTVGIITMDDMIDALVGDVSEDIHDEYKIVERDENSWFVDGQYPILDFIKYFDIETEDASTLQFSTVAGLIINKTNTLPEIGNKITIDQYEIEIIDKDGQRIDKLLVSKIKS